MHHEDTPNDIVVNHSSNEHLDQLVEARLSRRGALQAIAAGVVATVAGSACDSSANDAVARSTLDFTEVAHGQTPATLAPREYATQVVARWGDRVLPDAPKFDVKKQTADAQSQQLGYNCDFVAFMPLPLGSNNSKHGLLCVNHEYTDPHMMFPGLSSSDRVRKVTKDQVDVELAAHGHSVVEVIKLDGRWQLVPGHHNRRITASETEMRIAGPAAGHPRMRTSADPDGMAVIGTINNCAGGTTPWGTVLIAEENFQNYFGGVANDGDEARNCKRYGIAGSPSFGWSRFYDRFDVEKEPNEPNRFGWIVEFDPYDPKSVPVKRTALGRMRHEAATTVVAPNGRLVVYSGDDGRGEYFYKFVTREKYDPRRRAANANLLDDGTLYVAKFSADGTLEWLPLSFGVGPLTPKNDFNSQADVLIETRRAADLLGATKMDRPEDAETNPRNGRVYVMLTNNTKR
ncbi:MAG: PhoX family phosphatase, partial [Pirellulales bacterium]|nr:PhoX family phosphatase [Pirellulales bacterium]